MLESFLARCHRDPTARTRLRVLYTRFVADLSPREASLWPRWRFVQELEASGLILGHDSAKRLCVAGLSLVSPPAWVRDEAGRLVKVQP